MRADTWKMRGGTLKIVALVAVLAFFVFLEFQTAEAQLVNECRSQTLNNCDVNAYCYDTPNSYFCQCRRGWYGDGLVGPGYNGCTRRRISTWRIIVSIIGSILGALLLACCLAGCIRNCVRARSRRAMEPQGDPAYGYPAQQPYPPQQGVPMHATQTNKVPPPAGVV